MIKKEKRRNRIFKRVSKGALRISITVDLSDYYSRKNCYNSFKIGKKTRFIYK